MRNITAIILSCVAMFVGAVTTIFLMNGQNVPDCRDYLREAVQSFDATKASNISWTLEKPMLDPEALKTIGTLDYDVYGDFWYSRPE